MLGEKILDVTTAAWLSVLTAAHIHPLASIIPGFIAAKSLIGIGKGLAFSKFADFSQTHAGKKGLNPLKISTPVFIGEALIWAGASALTYHYISPLVSLLPAFFSMKKLFLSVASRAVWFNTTIEAQELEPLEDLFASPINYGYSSKTIFESNGKIPLDILQEFSYQGVINSVKYGLVSLFWITQVLMFASGPLIPGLIALKSFETTYNYLMMSAKAQEMIQQENSTHEVKKIVLEDDQHMRVYPGFPGSEEEYSLCEISKTKILCRITHEFEKISLLARFFDVKARKYYQLFVTVGPEESKIENMDLFYSVIYSKQNVIPKFKYKPITQ